jgi:AraC-like DNA-binding protein
MQADREKESESGVGGSTPVAPPFAPVHITTEAFPQAKRLAMWREIYGRVIARFDIEPLGDIPFHADVACRSLPGLGIVSGTRSDAHYRMTRELAAKAGDNLIFAVVTRGVGCISQFGREAVVSTGCGVLLSGSDPSVCTLRSFGRFVTIAAPRDTLAPLLADPCGAFVRAVPETSDALRLLMRYLGVFEEPLALASEDVAKSVVSHIVDLAALAIGPTRAANEIASGRGLRVARLNAIKADIDRLAAEEDLSVARIAARHRVTPRYVHMLFEAEGRTFSEYVVERRLTRAHRMLTEPRFADRTISAIAFDVGFSNLSHFNRVFRRRYDGTPSEVRDAARRRIVE